MPSNETKYECAISLINHREKKTDKNMTKRRVYDFNKD